MVVAHFGTYLTQFPRQGLSKQCHLKCQNIHDKSQAFLSPLYPKWPHRWEPTLQKYGFYWVFPAPFSLELRLNEPKLPLGIQHHEHSQHLKKQPQTSTDYSQIFWEKQFLLSQPPPAHPMVDGTTSTPQTPEESLAPGPCSGQNPTTEQSRSKSSAGNGFHSLISHPNIWGIWRSSFYTQLYVTQDTKMQFFSPPFFKPSFSSQGERRVVGLLWLHFNITNRKLL